MTLLGRLRQWSLRRRLIVGTAALVLVTLLFAGAATVLSLRASLYERLDEDVLTGLDIARGPAGTAPDAGVPEGPGPRQRIGTLEVVFAADGTATSSAYVGRDGRVATLTPSQLETISAELEDDRTPVTVDLGGTLGAFRVASESTGGAIVVAGQSMRDVAATIASLTAILAFVVAAGLLVATIGIAWLVRAALRPLGRVADTAERVSQRPLEVGP